MDAFSRLDLGAQAGAGIVAGKLIGRMIGRDVACRHPADRAVGRQFIAREHARGMHLAAHERIEIGATVGEYRLQSCLAAPRPALRRRLSGLFGGGDGLGFSKSGIAAGGSGLFALRGLPPREGSSNSTMPCNSSGASSIIARMRRARCQVVRY